MHDNFIDLIVTSPSYDNMRSYNKVVNGHKEQFNNHSFPFEDIAKELYRITMVVCWFG